jgi:lipopolysaccharide transport system ATP-binding protein
MSTVIKVEGLSKQYRLGNVGTGSLFHDVNRTWYRIRGLEDPYLKIGDENDRTVKGTTDYVWALKDINFEVKHGEVLGIIGNNGAGKSTLLKILSRTTSPTTGQVKIKGRVASLLEVGTGFHPELTGRENIFLNGAILGMTKSEIKRKFDEIAEFSGVEKYIDTPVKRYSSGMYVRLAFGVAAHMEPEILIVDEVLAVGDAEFQKKALGKMKDVSGKEGRTVLFVSHNMASIVTLCNTGLVLANGKSILNDTAVNCVSYYQSDLRNKNTSSWEPSPEEDKTLSKVKIKLNGEQPHHSLEVMCSINRNTAFKPSFIAIDISNSFNAIMQAIPTLDTFIDFSKSKDYSFKIDLLGIVPGHYSVTIWIGPHNSETYIEKVNIVSFEIVSSPTVGRTVPHTIDHGFMVPNSSLIA